MIHSAPTKIEPNNTHVQFWEAAYVIVLGHSFAIYAFCVLIVGLTATATAFLRGNPRFILLACFLSALLILPTPFAIIGFYRRHHTGKGLITLILYITIQFCYAMLIFKPCIESIINPQPHDIFHELINDFITTFLTYVVLCFPLFLLAGRGMWVLIVKPSPPTDDHGRYLNCIECKYDLRGTPGPTCPECGAPVIAEKAGVSTAAG